MSDGWIGIDLDGTLAAYDRWRGVDHVGDPVALMLDRARVWVAAGRDVRIFTARVSVEGEELARTVAAIEAWCLRHIGKVLPITCRKDYGMVALWDDRAIQIVPNTGRRADDPGEPLDGEDRRLVAYGVEKTIEGLPASYLSSVASKAVLDAVLTGLGVLGYEVRRRAP